MLQTDSIQVIAEAGEEQVVQKHYQPTPAQILKWLPKDATPAQQDSAIQKHIKPCEIHWSERPDTLHLPGQPVGKSILDTTLPQYYKESFFSDKPYFHPEITGGRQGVAGDPIPYSVASDNFMTSLLLILILFSAMAFTHSMEFIGRQVKSFFYTQRGTTTEVTETTNEIRFQLMLVVETCLLMALLFFSYMKEQVDTFIIGQPQTIGLFTALFIAYFIVKFIIQSFVNWTFFDEKNIEQWIKSHLFLLASEGLVLMPLVLMRLYFNLALDTTLIVLIIIVFLFKILSFYKSYATFFASKGKSMQIFLYFCTLELIPMAILGCTLVVTSEYIKINF